MPTTEPSLARSFDTVFAFVTQIWVPSNANLLGLPTRNLTPDYAPHFSRATCNGFTVKGSTVTACAGTSLTFSSALLLLLRSSDSDPGAAWASGESVNHARSNPNDFRLIM